MSSVAYFVHFCQIHLGTRNFRLQQFLPIETHALEGEDKSIKEAKYLNIHHDSNIAHCHHLDDITRTFVAGVRHRVIARLYPVYNVTITINYNNNHRDN